MYALAKCFFNHELALVQKFGSYSKLLMQSSLTCVSYFQLMTIFCFGATKSIEDGNLHLFWRSANLTLQTGQRNHCHYAVAGLFSFFDEAQHAENSPAWQKKQQSLQRTNGFKSKTT